MTHLSQNRLTGWNESFSQSSFAFVSLFTAFSLNCSAVFWEKKPDCMRLGLESKERSKVLHGIGRAAQKSVCNRTPPPAGLAGVLGGGLAAASGGLQAVLRHALRGQLRQNVVQVVGVGVTVARQVGHHLGFVVDAVPHHRVGLAGGAGRSHGEDEAPHPRHLQQLQDLDDKTKKARFNLRYSRKTSRLRIKCLNASWSPLWRLLLFT